MICMSKVTTARNKNYVSMATYHLRDKNLSLRSRGLMSFMLQLPDTWEFSVAGLAAVIGCGRDQIRAGVKELESKGYLFRCARGRDEKGRLTGEADYILYERPAENPALENPTLDAPTLAAPTQLITNHIKNENINNEIKAEYAPGVFLTKEEHEKIMATMGTAREADGCLKLLSAYKKRSGKKYADDYKAVEKWVIRAYREQKEKAKVAKPRQMTVAEKAIAMIEAAEG